MNVQAVFGAIVLVLSAALLLVLLLTFLYGIGVTARQLWRALRGLPR